MSKALRAGEAGNMALILPLVVATVIAGALMWNYSTWRTNTAQGTRAALNLRLLAQNILNRTKTLLTTPGGTITTTVGNPCGGINTDLATFRNLAVVPPGNEGIGNAYSYTFTNSGPGTLGDTCLLLDTEMPPNTDLSSATLTVAYVSGADDLLNLSRKVAISVHVVTNPTVVHPNGLDQSQAQTFDLEQVVTLRAATLADYGLVLYGAGGITASASLVFLSPVYDANPGTPTVALTSVVTAASQPNVTFRKRLDLAARGLSTAAAVSMATMGNLFQGGVRNLVYSSAYTTLWPLSGAGFAGGDTGPTGTAWTQTVGVSHIGSNLVPNPSLHTGAAVSEPNMGGPGGALNLAGLPAGGTLPVFPIGGGAAPYAGGLVTSCAPGGQSQFFYAETGNAVTINMDGTGNNGVLCGFIAADSVSIVLSAGSNYFFGTIITRSLSVTGTGTLYIGNPYHDDLGLDETAVFTVNNEKFSDLRNQFQLQALEGLARNFFVPILRYPPPMADPSSRFRPNGPLSIYYTYAAGSYVIPGAIYPCSASVVAMQSPATGCWAFNPGVAPSGGATFAPFISVLPANTNTSLGYLAPSAAYAVTPQAAIQNANDLFWNGKDNVVFQVVDP